VKRPVRSGRHPCTLRSLQFAQTETQAPWFARLQSSLQPNTVIRQATVPISLCHASRPPISITLRSDRFPLCAPAQLGSAHGTTLVHSVGPKPRSCIVGGLRPYGEAFSYRPRVKKTAHRGRLHLWAGLGRRSVEGKRSALWWRTSMRGKGPRKLLNLGHSFLYRVDQCSFCKRFSQKSNASHPECLPLYGVIIEGSHENNRKSWAGDLELAP